MDLEIFSSLKQAISLQAGSIQFIHCYVVISFKENHSSKIEALITVKVSRYERTS